MELIRESLQDNGVSNLDIAIGLLALAIAEMENGQAIDTAKGKA